MASTPRPDEQASNPNLLSSGQAARPYAFLVSTTGCARGIRNTLGSAAYSYYFVLEALAPVLERLGTWRLLDHPESSLPFAAARAEADGYQPIHLSLHPPQDVYLTPALPNVIFPFWEFPDLPDRDFGHDTRQNWVRVCSRADLILTACEFTARAFQKAGVNCPVAVVPVPLKPDHFTIPAWDAGHTWTLTCRHVIWGGPEPVKVETHVDKSSHVEAPRWLRRVDHRPSGGHFCWLAACFARFTPGWGRRPWSGSRRPGINILVSSGRSPHTMQPLPGARPGVSRLGYAMARDGYRKFIKRWLSLDALHAITGAKVKALRVLGRDPILDPDPLLPSTALTLGGLIYSSIFNLGDKRKNHQDLLTAYLLAFADREDVTLVIKLATNPVREHHEISILRLMYDSLGIKHKCRIVVITDFLTDEQMHELMRVTTFYVNTSKAEGACLPLQQSLAGGRPSIAPDHTSMADFMDSEVGFVLGTHPEPTYWPHDPEMKMETTWNRLVWSDLRDALLDSASLIETRPEDYQTMAKTARTRMLDYASRDVTTEALRAALARLPKIETGRFAWAS